MVFAMASCAQEPTPDRNAAADGKEGGVEIALTFPEMSAISTRTLGENPTTPLKDMDLFLFVFDGTHLLQTIHIPDSDETRSFEGGVLKFTAYLPQTDNDATIHIIAIDDKDGSFADQIDDNGYGIEDTVMPGLSVFDGKDAYWQRVELDCRIIVTVKNEGNNLEDVEGTESQVKEKFAKPIPLIRNFAKISLKKADDYERNNPGNIFDILGWTIVNERNGGSVVPWYSKSGNPDVNFAEYYDFSNSQGRSYRDMTSDGYQGVSVAGAELKNTLAQIGDYSAESQYWTSVSDNATTSRYLYERKIATVNPLYIIIYGRYYGSDRTSWEDRYYKLTLGHTDKDTGLFTEYNVLRNIAYEVIIDAVTSPGARTLHEAATGPASNNLSGDVVTRNMLNISDGVDMLYVNFTNYIVTLEGQSVDFKYKYVKNIESSRTPSNEAVYCEEPGIGIAAGDVVKSFTHDKMPDSDGWNTIHIEFNAPSNVLKQQTFTIFSKPDYENDGTLPETNTMGLSRTINLILREPWDFVRMETFPGQWNDDEAWPDYDPDAPDGLGTTDDGLYFVGAKKGDPLTIFFELPAGLPQAIFPLDFTFESDRQNIENAGAGTAVVQSGPSLFPNVLDHRISYVKPLTWEEYTAGTGENSSPASRIQRARFITTTNIMSLEDVSYTTTVILHNPYFNDATDQFERSQNNFSFVDPDAQMPSDMIWDFSTELDENWSQFLDEIQNGTQTINRSFAGLTIIQGVTGTTAANQRRRMTSSGSDAEERYIATRGSGDKFSFTVSFPAKDVEHKAVLKVTADAENTNATGNNRANIVESRNVIPNNSVSAPVANENDYFTEKKTRTYEYTIPAAATTLTITLQPATNYDNNNAVRIYKIEFYPVGVPQTNPQTDN